MTEHENRHEQLSVRSATQPLIELLYRRPELREVYPTAAHLDEVIRWGA